MQEFEVEQSVEFDQFREFIPLDKSWTIRMGLLDRYYAYSDTNEIILESGYDINDDIQAMLDAKWKFFNGETIDVGESGTLFRFMQYMAWQRDMDVDFIRHGTLLDRDITTDKELVLGKSQEELLLLDNGTSQWASASALFNPDVQRMENPPYKLKLTYDAVDHWYQKRIEERTAWEVKIDRTIEYQAWSFVELMQGREPYFTPEQAEDFCFMVAFGYGSIEDGEQLWPALRSHETDRIEEMKIMLEKYANGDPIDSNDHRVVQAIAMKSKVDGSEVEFINPECVAKSWPRFWEFIEAAEREN